MEGTALNIQPTQKEQQGYHYDSRSLYRAFSVSQSIVLLFCTWLGAATCYIISSFVQIVEDLFVEVRTSVVFDCSITSTLGFARAKN